MAQSSSSTSPDNSHKSGARIQAVVWDIGGVLLTNGWDHVEREAVLEHFRVERAGYEERHPDNNDAWEKGLMTVEQFLIKTVFFEPRPFTPSEFVAEMKDQSQLLPKGAMRILQNLAASDEVTLAMLNNEARELNEWRIERFGLRNYFDAFLSSCYVGLRKPDARMFALALDVLQLEAGEVAFVDDRDKNCAAAAAVGMHAIQYRDEAGLVEELKRLGVGLELAVDI